MSQLRKMNLKHPKILLTGPPRVGKTTLIRKTVQQMSPERTAGFLTTEIRERGERAGFSLEGLNGEQGVLAHVEIFSRFQVGKYGVDVAGFDAFLERLDLWRPGIGCIVIDEIGKMEVLSKRFCALVRRIADADRPFLATVAVKGGGLIAEIKRRRGIRLVTVTAKNRDDLLDEILA